jgi:hypothetical protein
MSGTSAWDSVEGFRINTQADLDGSIRLEMYTDSIFTKGPKWDVLRMLRWKNGVTVLME